MDVRSLYASLNQLMDSFAIWISSPAFYAQLSLVLVALVLASLFSRTLKKHAPVFHQAPTSGPVVAVRQKIFELGDLVFYVFAIVALGVADELSRQLQQGGGLTRVAQGVAILFLLSAMVRKLVSSPLIAMLFKWGLLPIAALHLFGLLDEAVALLDRLSLSIGNIHLTASSVIRVIIFGSLLFWLGRLSNNLGKQVIRSQQQIDLGMREVFAKLFEVGLYMLVFVLLLQVMGVNLTALAVFGGALGVGLGFGLQAIASNFISGIIILLDRSISVGDYIELEDGRSGTIRELNMRFTLLETFEGKDIMVPNESFITSSFVNWTHTDQRQRYSLNFSVAYSTDLRRCIEIVREMVRAHPQVLSGDDLPFELQPDCEVCGFGESGVEMLVEWWMLGVDDGKNRVGGDLLLMIFEALRDAGIVIPFPQREIKILSS